MGRLGWSVMIALGLVSGGMLVADTAAAQDPPCNATVEDCGGDPCDEGPFAVGCETETTPDVPPPDDGGPGGPGPGGGPGTPVGEPVRTCWRDGPVTSTKGYLGDQNEILEYWYIQCDNPDFRYQTLVCVARCPAGYNDPTPDAPPPPDPAVIRDRVYAGVRPVPPPAVVAPEDPVVAVPAFLQVEGFEVRTAADSEGGLTVEVTATPVEVRWTFGDASRTCSSGGGPFTPEKLDAAIATGDGLIDDGEVCTFLFTTSSAKAAGGPLAASVTTVWDYSWSLNGVDQGVFNPAVVSPPTAFDLTVREYQAVIRD